jgi:hypothetical protein
MQARVKMLDLLPEIVDRLYQADSFAIIGSLRPNVGDDLDSFPVDCSHQGNLMISLINIIFANADLISPENLPFDVSNCSYILEHLV